MTRPECASCNKVSGSSSRTKDGTRYGMSSDKCPIKTDVLQPAYTKTSRILAYPIITSGARDFVKLIFAVCKILNLEQGESRQIMLVRGPEPVRQGLQNVCRDLG